jgi:hypothetical protein
MKREKSPPFRSIFSLNLGDVGEFKVVQIPSILLPYQIFRSSDFSLLFLAMSLHVGSTLAPMLHVQFSL